MSHSSVDMSGHNGLRGIAAMWIMIFHCFLYSTCSIDLQGSSIMPLFFLLSGFSLTITYCKDPFIDVSSLVYQQESNSTWKVFMINRFARVFPTYYLSILFALPLCFVGFNNQNPLDYSAIIVQSIISIIPISTLLSFGLGAPINGVSWTIATLLFMWLFFHRSLSYLVKLTDEQLVSKISIFYWIQLLLVIILFYFLVPFTGFWIAFATATMNPLTRMPIFLMGICAGLLFLRHPISTVSTPGSTLPWNSSIYFLFPKTAVMLSTINPSDTTSTIPPAPLSVAVEDFTLLPQSLDNDDDGDDTDYDAPLRNNHSDSGTHSSSSINAYSHSTYVNKNTTNTTTTATHGTTDNELFWSSRLMTQSMLLLCLTLSVAAVDTLVKRLTATGASLLGAVWLQAVVPFAQLEVIVDVRRDITHCCGDNHTSRHTSIHTNSHTDSHSNPHNNSNTHCYEHCNITKFLQSDVCKWLGDRSMCIYLFHYPIIYYLCWMRYGGAVLYYPTIWDCDQAYSNEAEKKNCWNIITKWLDARVIPLWGVPAVVLTTLLAAHFVYTHIEEPCRKYFRR